MFVIRRHYRLDRHWRVTGPAIAGVDNSILTSANLATHGGHTWRRDHASINGRLGSGTQGKSYQTHWEGTQMTKNLTIQHFALTCHETGNSTGDKGWVFRYCLKWEWGREKIQKAGDGCTKGVLGSCLRLWNEDTGWKTWRGLVVMEYFDSVCGVQCW